MSKPILVFTPNPKHQKQFDNIHAAEWHAWVYNGVIYRREDWYQFLKMLVRILIRRV